MTDKLDIFHGESIRKTTHNGEWWFVIEDCITALTGSTSPKQYIKDIRERDSELKQGWGKISTTLDIKTEGGVQKMNCANTEGMFRIVQSIPSPKAEPFKRFLAKAGYERVQEIENPELGMMRTRALYKAMNRPDDWIDRRIRGIKHREELTDTWKDAGVFGKQYAILTAELAGASLGIKPAAHKSLKGLTRENLRDHMTDLELTFTDLGEQAAKEITKSRKPKNFDETKQATIDGGNIAGQARKELEEKSGKRIVSGKNFIDAAELLE